MQTVEEVIRSGSVSIIVVDSVAALLPASEIAREAGDPQVGAQAKLMSNHLKRIAASAAKYNVAVLFINQLRMKIGVMFGNPEVRSRTYSCVSACVLCLGTTCLRGRACIACAANCVLSTHLVRLLLRTSMEGVDAQHVRRCGDRSTFGSHRFWPPPPLPPHHTCMQPTPPGSTHTHGAAVSHI